MSAKKYIILAVLLLQTVLVSGQHAALQKLSPMLRTAHHAQRSADGEVEDTREACVFVRVSGNASELFLRSQARELARFGDIYIVSVPFCRIGMLADSPQVTRVEAGSRCSLHMDSTAMHVNALPVYEGAALPQAYTGQGVVVGVQDIGFDLTHPTFYSRDLAEYRIRRFWDMLAARDASFSGDNDLYVGADFSGQSSLLSYAHSRDGMKQTHGTHTLGIAAGSGYDTAYRGMAWESDICIVANAVTEDVEFVDSLDYYKYTTATDALGFKYIFDYAQSVGKPCVLSFSEGSRQGFSEDDQLFDEVLEALTGPGRILVASAGNDGQNKSYVHKPRGRVSAGTFLLGRTAYYTMKMKSDAPFDMRMVVYADGRSDTLVIPSECPVLAADSEYVDTLWTPRGPYVFDVIGYPSRFNPAENAFELYLSAPCHFGGDEGAVSMEVLGADADVHMYLGGGFFLDNALNPSLCDAENTHSIHSPASAPAVICVGANAYRTGVINYRGEWFPFGLATDGFINEHSSVGPTYDERVKPDVVAPGVNIISSFSSFYRETYPDREYIDSDVAHFDFQGRTYAWNAMSGTSMATPVVAGAVALWLQAAPDLTPDEVKAVLAVTCRQPDPSLDYPNNHYGYGEIDVYRGLLEVLRRRGASVDHLSTAQPSGVTFSVVGDQLSLTFSSALTTPVSVKIFSLSGKQLFAASFPVGSSQSSLSLAALPAGVYAVQVDSRDPRFRGSTLVRLGR